MAITKYAVRRPSYSPWSDLDSMSSRFARLFEDPMLGGGVDRPWSPPVSVSESKDELLLTAELPGMKGDDISIELENNVLTVSGHKLEESREDDEERNYHVYERSFGSFSRSFTLPRTVDGNGIVATFDNGVLTVTLPKVAEAKGRKIAISK